MMQNFFSKINSFAHIKKIIPNIWDIIIFFLFFCIAFAYLKAWNDMNIPINMKHTVVLKINNLFDYTIQTVLRMFIALFFSFIFTFIFGTLAAKYTSIGKILIPLIDILQSVPVLGYLSITISGFMFLFPNSMLGPSFAAIFAVFTSQVWNMTLSFYQSLITIPAELIEVTKLYQLSSWQRFWKLEVPFSIPGLIWNSMISMSGGWFFIVAAEAISIGNQNILIPGIGSYIALAIEKKNISAIIFAILDMSIIIFLYNKLLFQPIIAWSQKFYTNTRYIKSNSWIIEILQRGKVFQYLFDFMRNILDIFINNNLCSKIFNINTINIKKTYLITFFWYFFIFLILFKIVNIFYNSFLLKVSLNTFFYVIELGFFTAIRVFSLIIICSFIWVPIGVWIGLHPKNTNTIQILAQFLASFPANLFFPFAFLIIIHFNLNFEIWCAPLMIFGTQWYILFNIISGTKSIPKELKLVVKNIHLKGWLKWKRFLIPAIFPSLITGVITSAGGAWNASIVAEIINWGNQKLIAHGLGSYITINTIKGNFSNIKLGIFIMCIWIIFINIILWKPLYKYTKSRFTTE